jgi:hypothetical protein
MSCSVTPKLLSYYSDKVNIYDSNCFIRLPDYKTCPPPSCVLLAPQLVYPTPGPYIPPVICPLPQPLNYPGAYCGMTIAPYNPVCGSSNQGCGPCGSKSEYPSYTPSNGPNQRPQVTGCSSCS